MVQYRDLNAPPSRMLAEVVADMRASERQSKTGDAGVKDLGESGDVVWPRPDGTPVSVRDIDAELVDAVGRIEDAEQESAGLAQRVTDAEASVGAVTGDLTTLETVTLPGAVAELEAADQANAQAVADAETRSNQARTDLAAQIDQDIADAADALSSDINSVRTSVDGKSKITQSLDAPPAQYTGAAGDRWERMSSLGSGGRLVSNWRWNGTVWVSTIIDGAVLGNVDASTISAGFLDSARIKAGSLYADKIVSGLSQNMVPDAGFSNPEINATRLAGALGYGDGAFAIADGVLSITTGGGAAGHPNVSLATGADRRAWAAYPAMKIVCRTEARVATGAGQVTMTILFSRRDGSTGSSTMTGGYQNVTSAWATYLWSYDLPQDVVGFSITVQVHRLNTNGTIEFRSPFVAAPTGTTLIEPGAITTDRLAANSVVAGKIASGAIETQHLKAGAITVGIVPGLQGALDGKETPAGAQAKADAAKAEAQQAAAADAQSKADAAKAAAEDAAKTYADAVAEGASQAAIDAAEADATAKANAAEVAAVAAAEAAAAAEYGETKTLVGGWRETGQTTIAGGAITTDSITAGHLKSGAVTTAKLAVTEDMSAAIVNAMSVNAKNLVVTEEAVLNHATLIGQTVVDDINVQGKLIGTDGVFTGTVDFENVNVTGTQIVNKLGANSISADKISGGSFSGQTFEGGMFVGGVFATNMRPSTDGGLSINATNGLRAWNSSGKQTVSIDPINGDLRMGAGVYLTGSDRNGLVLNPPSAIGTASIYFTAGEDMGANDAAIWRLGYSTGKEPLMLRGANGGGISVPSAGAENYFGGNLEVGQLLNVWGQLIAYDWFRYMNPPSSGVSSANVYLNPTNGVVARMTSSRRYKRNIEDWEIDSRAVLALQPRTWQANTPLEGDDPEAWFVGFVAEEVHDLGLTELVQYDEGGKPDALHYATFSVAQQAVLQKHEAEIHELRERIALLEEQIGTT